MSLPCEDYRLVLSSEWHEWKPSIRSLSLLWDVYSRSWFPNVFYYVFPHSSQISGYDPQLARWDMDQAWELSMSADDSCGKKRRCNGFEEIFKQPFERFNPPKPFFFFWGVFLPHFQKSLYIILSPGFWHVLTCFDRRLEAILSQLTSNNLEPSLVRHLHKAELSLFVFVLRWCTAPLPNGMMIWRVLCCSDNMKLPFSTSIWLPCFCRCGQGSLCAGRRLRCWQFRIKGSSN